MTITSLSSTGHLDAAASVTTVPVSDPGYDAWPGLASSADLAPVTKVPELPEVPRDLTDVTTRQLRRWSNQLFKLLDADFPPFGVIEDSERVVAELEAREERAREGAAPSIRRDTVRDNTMNRRFELFQDGMLAGYVSYSMRAGSLRLHRTVVAEAFEGAGLDQVLIRGVLLSAHKRRLSVLPYCAEVQSFLGVNPQYRALIAS